MTHPLIPPPELVQQWLAEFYGTPVAPGEASTDIAIRAAQYGADQELEACCEWLDRNNQWAKVDLDELRDGRRPKPMSLKKQALQALSEAVKMADDVPPEGICSDQADIIRRALEALPE